MDERVWLLRAAKDKLPELVDRAIDGEAQVITRRGKRAAVLISADEYARLTCQAAKMPMNFVQHLLAAPKGDVQLPKRTKAKHRRLDLG